MNLTEIVRTWPVVEGWSVAPAGLTWIAEGSRIRVGTDCQLGDGCSLGDYCQMGGGCQLGDRCQLGGGCRLGDGGRLGGRASDPVDVGACEGYRKTVSSVDGVAYVGAGCRWFTLAKAKAHWAEREDRALTRALLLSMTEIARIKGWKEN